MSVQTVYIAMADDDAVVPVQVLSTPEDADGRQYGGEHRQCEVCMTTVASFYRDGKCAADYFKPHTYEPDMTNIAICLPCQMGQVATGVVLIVDEATAMTILKEPVGKHAA